MNPKTYVLEFGIPGDQLENGKNWFQKFS